MVIAGLVSATRISDLRHFGLDVFAGAALGAMVALIVYRIWHPWLTDLWADIPWDVLRMDERENQVHSGALPAVHSNDGRYYGVGA
jgi:membrane-associated phospholipid phosphatase